MRRKRSVVVLWILAGLAGLMLAGCAGGTGSQWKVEGAEPAGFFAGLWHGLLLVLTLVVSFFTDQVSVYETHNVGTAYNIGFVLGTLIAYGSGCRVTFRRHKPPSDWDGFAERVEHRIKKKIAGAVEDEEWGDIEAKIEKKVKERLRRWLEED